VVYEHADDEEPYGVLTGDTLFIGDVGRPDLLASIGFTKEELADQLYDSLHDKLLVLPDSHPCLPGPRRRLGLRQEPVDRDLVDDRRTAATNYALRAGSKPGLLRPGHRGQPPAPGYFAYDAILNRKDRELLDETAMPEALDLEQLRSIASSRRARWWSTVAIPRTSLVVTSSARSTSGSTGATPSSPARSCRTTSTSCSSPTRLRARGKNRLARIGFDRVVGYLEHPLKVMAEHPDRVRPGVAPHRGRVRQPTR
jgi:hydroxyacylglutathione hydrolase